MVSLSSVKLHVAVEEDLTVVILTSTANASLSHEAASGQSNLARALLDTLMPAESQEMRDTRRFWFDWEAQYSASGVAASRLLVGRYCRTNKSCHRLNEVGGSRRGLCLESCTHAREGRRKELKSKKDGK